MYVVVGEGGDVCVCLVMLIGVLFEFLVCFFFGFCELLYLLVICLCCISCLVGFSDYLRFFELVEFVVVS